MISIDELRKMFVGKKVLISHSGNDIQNKKGVCKAIHVTPGSLSPFDIELRNKSRYGFWPTTVTDSSCEGELGALAGGNRKIEVI